MKKIIFCFPYRGVGGVSLMFSRFASYLQDLGYRVAVVDYIDGYMAKNVDNEVELLVYSDVNKLSIPDNSIIVFQTMTPWSIYPMLKIADSALLYFITTLPINLYPIFPGLRQAISASKSVAFLIWHTLLYSEYLKIRSFLSISVKKMAIAFLDQDIVNNINYVLGASIRNPYIIPLFNEYVEKNIYIDRVKSGEKKNKTVIGWLGRIADFKIHILNKLIDDAESFVQKNNHIVELVIVGSGECFSDLKLANLQYLKVKHIEYIAPKALDEFLLTLDILFAMGTSALEGAKFGVPTVRLDYSFKPIKGQYQYKWLYETNDYSLAQQIGSKHYQRAGHMFKVLIEQVKSNHRLLSEKTFCYYQQYHSIQTATQKLLYGL